MQHLNLFHQIERQVEPPFSARMQARLVGGVAAAMVIIYISLWAGTGGLGGELSDLKAQQQALDTQMAQMKKQKAELENNPELDADIARLQREVNFRRELLANIEPDSQASSEGFAQHLSGLARQHIDGLWFTEIQLHQGGQKLALLGQTKAPEYVPQYLQKLSSEPVFEGHRFRVLRLHTPEERKRVHSFELRANDIGATP